MKFESNEEFEINWPNACIGCGNEDPWGTEEFKQVQSLHFKRTNTSYFLNLPTKTYLCASCKLKATQMIDVNKKSSMNIAYYTFALGFIGIIIFFLPDMHFPLEVPAALSFASIFFSLPWILFCC
jgi:hypothetical protein